MSGPAPALNVDTLWRGCYACEWINTLPELLYESVSNHFRDYDSFRDRLLRKRPAMCNSRLRINRVEIMLRGHLDSITSLGFIEGWAFDPDNPAKPLEVSVLWDGVEVAWGLAHRFRQDLMLAGLGLGWCALRLRLEVPIEQAQKGVVRLLERRTSSDIFVTQDLQVVPDGETPMDSIEALKAADPTVISALSQLRQCDPLLVEFIRVQGVDAFLNAAYPYVLGRPADDAGRASYSRAIRMASLSPVGVLETLGESEEFRKSSRLLAAPNSPEFPFSCI
jgi:hypothetical protein